MASYPRSQNGANHPNPTPNIMSKKITIRQKVEASIEFLRTCQSHTQLREWAVSHGIDNRAAFPKFKDALSEFGISYEEMRSGAKAAADEEVASKITHELTLITDAKASHSRFAICDGSGNVVWFGRFFDNDRDFNGEQSSGELAAAKKAVWLAGKVKEALGAPAMRLTLKVDAQWLTYQDKFKQKGSILTAMAKAANIELHVEWIAGTSNPADKWTTASGFKKYDIMEVAATAEEIETEVKVSDATPHGEGETIQQPFAAIAAAFIAAASFTQMLFDFMA